MAADRRITGSTPPGPTRLVPMDRKPVRRDPRQPARIIFSLDATGSRSATWQAAREFQAAMFDTVGTEAAEFEVQLAYFRGGRNECRASRWTRDSRALANWVNKIECQGGPTQIARLLRHALAESAERRIDALIYTGDGCEEAADELLDLSIQLGDRGVPIYVFREVPPDPATAMLGALDYYRHAFGQMAKGSGGAVFDFDLRSSSQVAILLAGIAAYSRAGRQALDALINRHRHDPAIAAQLKMIARM